MPEATRFMSSRKSGTPQSDDAALAHMLLPQPLMPMIRMPRGVGIWSATACSVKSFFRRTSQSLSTSSPPISSTFVIGGTNSSRPLFLTIASFSAKSSASASSRPVFRPRKMRCRMWVDSLIVRPRRPTASSVRTSGASERSGNCAATSSTRAASSFSAGSSRSTRKISFCIATGRLSSGARMKRKLSRPASSP